VILEDFDKLKQKRKNRKIEDVNVIKSKTKKERKLAT
jgi:hypothetical protein